MEVDGRCRGCTKVDGSLQKVPRLEETLGKLTEFLPAAENLMEVDGMSPSRKEIEGKLTKGLPASSEVHGSSRKVPLSHGKLTKVDRKYTGHTERSWKVSWPQDG